MSVKTKLEKWLFRVMRLPPCEDIEEFSYDFLEGKLDSATQRLVERHLRLCPPCLRFMESYRRSRALGAQERPPPLDPEFTEHLLKLFQS